MSAFSGIKVVAFDADDTLWENEHFFREAEEAFEQLLNSYLSAEEVHKVLFKNEMANLPLYGYGIKSFMLSMIGTILEVTDNKCDSSLITQAIDIGREMLQKPVVLIKGVEDVLESLNGKYKLMVTTKGDLLDQERKVQKSGLAKYFEHVEVMSNKRTEDYVLLFNNLNIDPREVLMIGNSLKSDILPILELGGAGVHIPFHITWAHEHIDEEVDHPRFRHADHITEILDWL